MKPPTLLVSMGFVKVGVWWEAKKAVYGYRQSPRLWSDFRDEVLWKMEVRDGSKIVKLIQMITEPNIWRILEQNVEQMEEDD